MTIIGAFEHVDSAGGPDCFAGDPLLQDGVEFEELKKGYIQLRYELDTRVAQLNDAIEVIEELGGDLEAAELKEAFFEIPIPD